MIQTKEVKERRKMYIVVIVFHLIKILIECLNIKILRNLYLKFKWIENKVYEKIIFFYKKIE